MANEIVVFISTGSTEEAEKIGHQLIETKLAACINILPAVKSIFHWQGKTCEEVEVLLIAKSHMEKFAVLESAVKQEHSYDVPEIIALPVIAGSKEYLDWIHEQTTE